MAGAITVLGIALVRPLFAPYGPDSIVGQAGALPSAGHLLGTDYFGRDVLSRFLDGGISVIALPLIAVSLALCLGGVTGLVSGYVGGAIDTIVVRAIDVVLSIPNFLLVIVIIAGFGTGEQVVVIAVALVYAPSIARVIRAATQAVAPREFVLAAQRPRRLLGVDRLPGDSAQYRPHSSGRGRAPPYFWDPLYSLPELPRAGCPASQPELGSHGVREP